MADNLETPEGRSFAAPGTAGAVDIHRAGPDAPDHAVGDTEVARPHPGRKPVLRVIRHGDDFIQAPIAVEWRDAEHGTEDLISHHGHAAPGVREYGWPHEVALTSHPLSPADHIGAVGAAGIDVRMDPIE